MNSQNSRLDQVTAEQAAQFAGVSINTLLRFAEAGYLNIDKNEDDVHFYSADLEKLFQISIDRTKLNKQATTDKSSTLQVEVWSTREPAPTSAPVSISPAPKDFSDTSGRDILAEQRAEARQHSVSSQQRAAINIGQDDSIHETILTPSPAVDIYAISAATEPEFIFSAEEQPEEKQLSQPTPGPGSTDITVESPDQKIFKLQRVIELQEKILDLKDKQIRDLKRQRKWLRDRIERLEDKANRDQLLLISETQAITRMLAHQMEKKSAITLALEWVGLKKPEHSILSSGTLSYESRKNQSDNSK